MQEGAHRITVDVQTSYLAEQSDPDEPRFVFSYTITIRNDGEAAARLMRRHWLITDANGKVQEVRGDGVVGEQPHLKPGQGFRYSSAAIIETPVGVMQGSYQMIADDGQAFDSAHRPVPAGHARRAAVTTPPPMARYAIGDLQGCATELRALLAQLKFSADRDRLWFVGDLVNRGPQSLECLRLIRALGDNAVVVLGNHDLHLLARAYGADLRDKPGDTLNEMLRAPDRVALLQWLLERPLAYQDPDARRTAGACRPGAAVDGRADRGAVTGGAGGTAGSIPNSSSSTCTATSRTCGPRGCAAPTGCGSS